MKIPKQEYTAELKELAVKRVKAGQAVGAVAKELGLLEQTLRNWVKAADAGKLNGPGVKSITPEQMELSRLRAENIRLKREWEELGSDPMENWGQTTVSRYGFLPKRSGNQETVVCPQFPDQIGKTVMTERTAVGLQPQQTAAAARWRRIAGNQFGGQMVVKIAASHGGPIEKWRRLMQKCR